jgi:flagellar motor switch/type III secretory pathway protein FliN
MKPKEQRCLDACRPTQTLISRRAAVGSSGLAVLGLLSRWAYGQEPVDWDAVREAQEKSRQRLREEMLRGAEMRGIPARPSGEEIRRLGSSEESTRAIRDWNLQQTLARLKNDLGTSEEEWAVVKPRIEAVYLLQRPPAFFAQEDTSAQAAVWRLTRELREMVTNKEAKPEEIKAKLAALRAAKEKVRQELAKTQQQLRQLMTLRHEAVLVLNGLLD